MLLVSFFPFHSRQQSSASALAVLSKKKEKENKPTQFHSAMAVLFDTIRITPLFSPSLSRDKLGKKGRNPDRFYLTLLPLLLYTADPDWPGQQRLRGQQTSLTFWLL